MLLLALDGGELSVSLVSRPVHYCRCNPRCLLNARLGGTQSQLELRRRVKKKKRVIWPLPNSKLESSAAQKIEYSLNLLCYIIIMQANEMHSFPNLFDKVIYMFRTGPLSIIRSISTLAYTQ